REARDSSKAIRCLLARRAIIRFIHRLLVHSDSSPRHLLHRGLSGQQWQVLQAEFADGLDDDFLKMAFELGGFLLVHGLPSCSVLPSSYFNSTSSITTGVFALMVCFRPGGMWTNVPAPASFTSSPRPTTAW